MTLIGVAGIVRNRWPASPGMGGRNRAEYALFEELTDETAVFTYAHRIWQFFKGLSEISISKIFELFEIDDDFQSYLDTLNFTVSRFEPIQGCES